jgi:AcrR family transcriptional regulator
MRRRYRMRERAAQVTATRDRIVDATIALYTDVGISATTLRAVGVRADVAPATLRNHFPTRNDLDLAIIQRLTAGVVLPDRSIFDGAASLRERLSRLIQAGGTFTDDASRLFRMWLREPMLTAPWIEQGAKYGAMWDELIREALGPLADDTEAITVLRAVIHPVFFQSVRGGTRSTDQAAALVTAVVSPWFAARARRPTRST